MDLLKKIQERYLLEFSENVSFDEFLINIVVTAVLIAFLRLFYIYYGNAISNRRKFASNFLPLSLGTMLIIMIIKSSVALSLGLVGALSIVRFRAAIKDPEELTYLFIAIGLGLAGGANEPVLAIAAFVSIISLLFIGKRITRSYTFKSEDRLFVNINTESSDFKEIHQILKAHFSHVELKRIDTLEKGLDLSFICKAKSTDEIDNARIQLSELPYKVSLSMIDQPDLIL